MRSFIVSIKTSKNISFFMQNRLIFVQIYQQIENSYFWGIFPRAFLEGNDKVHFPGGTKCRDHSRKYFCIRFHEILEDKAFHNMFHSSQGHTYKHRWCDHKLPHSRRDNLAHSYHHICQYCKLKKNNYDQLKKKSF